MGDYKNLEFSGVLDAILEKQNVSASEAGVVEPKEGLVETRVVIRLNQGGMFSGTMMTDVPVMYEGRQVKMLVSLKTGSDGLKIFSTKLQSEGLEPIVGSVKYNPSTRGLYSLN